MNTIKKEGTKRRKADSWQQRIEQAKKAKNKLRMSQTLEPVTVSPVEGMTTGYTVVGWIFRALVMFLGICGLMLFFCDAAALVNLSKSKADGLVLNAGFIVVWSAVVAAFYSLAGLTKPTRIAAPFVAVGAFAAYLFSTYADPIHYVTKSFIHFADLVMNNMAEVGYTTYLQYISEGDYGYPEEGMLKFAVAALILLFGSLLCVSVVNRVHPVPVVLISVLFLVPVFMFNLTRTNKGLALVLIFLCGIIALYLYDCWFMGILAAKKAKKEAKKAAKQAKKAARAAKKEHKQSIKRSALLAYTTAIESGMDARAAVKAKQAVYDKAKRDTAEAKKAAVLKKRNDKKAASEAKKSAKLAAVEAKKQKAEERKKQRAELAAVKKAKGDIKSVRNQFSAGKKAKRAERRAASLVKIKTTAAGGYAGVMAMVIAFLAVWIPAAVIEKNFPIIDPINNRMQLARTYVTAYLMGDDVDLNSLALYGGVAELNPRTVNFETPQYTGQRLFQVEAGYSAPVYLRSWIGTTYDTETDSWSSADTDQVIAYRSRFGSSYTSDNISYFFNKYVYPNALDIPKYDQYRNLDAYGFRVFQINVTRISGNSKLLFVPAVMNTGMGIMERGSIEPVSQKYSAFYDGIYSSRFFLEGSSYSTSSFVPVMKVESLGENYEGSIIYYNLAKKYCEAIDQINEEIAGNLLFKEDKEYTYETVAGTFNITGTDLSFMNDLFLSELATLTDYQYKVDSLVNMYLSMTAGERRTFHNAFNSELNYRDYANETYTTSFGLDKISELADQILADAGIVRHETPTYDKSFMEGMTENQIKRLSAVEKYGNNYESWFTDTQGNVIPRHEAIMAVINYLRYNYEYTLTPETAMKELLDEDGNVVLDEEGNPVMVADLSEETNIEAFLFEVKQGYCVHFATSAVALLRELGFAVRYDEGYIASGFNRTYDPEAVSTYRVNVRDYDAHSWIEVYYPAIGWVQYETTPEYAPDMYDIASAETSSSGGINNNKVTVKPETPEKEPLPEIELGTEEEMDYTPFIIAGCVILGIILLFSVVVSILKRRAGKAADKRKKLIDAARDEDAYFSGNTDVHKTARTITDCIFSIFEGMGVPHETGELPQDYAARLSEDYNELSGHKIADVMRIIEKEEFGGRLTYRELVSLGEYLEDITASIYASLPTSDKIRMRYFRNII